MCEPITIVGSVLAMATAIYQSQKQKKMAREQERLARESAEADEKILEDQRREINKKATLEDFQRRRQGLREMAKIKVANSEAGTFGNSLFLELANSMFNTGQDTSVIEMNRVSEIQQNANQKTKVEAELNSRVNQARASVPSPFMTGMQILNAGVNGYSTFSDFSGSLSDMKKTPNVGVKK